jgi:type II secretory pathway pseudopilin PulG
MRSGERAVRRGRRPRGFALVLLLVLVAVLGAASAHVVQLGHAASRRDAEQALLAAGEDFRLALLSWRRAERGGANPATRGPTELADLLRDPRVPGVRRHLRRIPVDPLTGRAEWGLVRDGGVIVAVHSLAAGRPIKRQGFAPWQAGFEEAESYAQWRFGFTVPVASRTTAPGAGL